MTKQSRTYKCRCGGVVAIPSGTRRFTLDYITKNHNDSCPFGARKVSKP